MKALIHGYVFDTRNADENDAYKELCKRLKSLGLKCFETHGGASHCFPFTLGVNRDSGVEIELETAHLFDNQWNTAPIEGVSESGLRVFDWAQDYNPHGNKHLKRGHWLDQTEDMREARRNTCACGYCGKQEPSQKGYVFCPHCIGSEYLKASDLYLTRMQRVDIRKSRAPLTQSESEYLLPFYREAQLHGRTEQDKKRIAKEREDLESSYKKAVYVAKVEHDGFLWFMDRGIRTDNLIYYAHTDRFCFGWRNPIDAEMLSGVLEVISEFPFSYDIKCADGQTRSGD
jgi:hypothetical protein